jgi:hypothetical protein
MHTRDRQRSECASCSDAVNYPSERHINRVSLAADFHSVRQRLLATQRSLAIERNVNYLCSFWSLASARETYCGRCEGRSGTDKSPSELNLERRVPAEKTQVIWSASAASF